MSKLPKWILESRDWPLEKPRWRACGIGCDMGEAGPGPAGQHDPNCEVVRYVQALSIAWEALRGVANYPYGMDGRARQLGEDAMRRILELGSRENSELGK